MPNWPVWWSYNLVISPHVIDRMKDRDFGEVDLRTLLEDAVDFSTIVDAGPVLHLESARNGEMGSCGRAGRT